MKGKPQRRWIQLIVRVPDDDKVLHTAYLILWHIAHAEFPDKCAKDLAICTYLHLIEELLEEHCLPYQGGAKWDNRKGTVTGMIGDNRRKRL